MPRYRRAPGVLVEPVGLVWAAFSPLSGETIVLNDESAAILEILDAGPATGDAVVQALARDCGVPQSELAPLVNEAWGRLVEGGLVMVDLAEDNARQ